ncbi:MAG: type IX secretion system sortase PorU, partial [Flavobacteriales bacterium]|nr:type IX secretion system sortase PorU [Flavobacteriales bacterium]
MIKKFAVFNEYSENRIIKMNNVYRLAVFGLLLVFGISQIHAQKNPIFYAPTKKVDDDEFINWKEPIVEVKYDGSTRTYLMFDGAVFLDDTSIPNWIKNVKVSSTSSIQPSFTDLQFENLTPTEIAALDGLPVSSTIQLKTDRYTERKQSFERVSFVPIRRSPTGQMEKLVSFKLNYRIVAIDSPKSTTATSYATISELASGNWYKIGVGQNGLYRVTYDDLLEMGMDVNSIDPRKLNVYGNGGGMLPQPNAMFRHDDLVQTAIEVVGESDGSFDSGDYIIFYAKGPHNWVQDSTSCGLFKHEFNIYSDKAYYFITVDRGTGRRVSLLSTPTDPITHSVTTFIDYSFHEADNVNLLKSGREWYGEVFDVQTSYGFDFGFSNVLANETAYVGARFLAKSSVSTSHTIKVNGTSVASSIPIPTTTGGYNAVAKESLTCTNVQLASGNTNVTVSYNKGSNPSAVGWLDYLEIVVKRNLSMAGGQMKFRDLTTVGTGNVADFQISNANGSVRVWDVSDPTNVGEMNLDLQGNTASFQAETDQLRQFIAFNGSVHFSPDLIGHVANQNLHGLSQVDMIIVAHPNFLSEAERLANFHQQNENNPLSVHIVTPAQIYNEYSSGAQDVTAIRDFMRMFYVRSISWEDMPRYLLLFGDASYDYKDRLADNTNYVPTYESLESLTPTISYASDDYYGLLDLDEGEWSSSANDALDIGIG